jgi:hypothetical protein
LKIASLVNDSIRKLAAFRMRMFESRVLKQDLSTPWAAT